MLQHSEAQSSDALYPNNNMMSSFREEGRVDATGNRKVPLPKPGHLTKRSVSLPADIQNTTVKTRNLFWFIPKGHRHQRGNRKCDDDFLEGNERRIGNRAPSSGWLLPCHQQLPQNATFEWIKTPCRESFDDSTISERSHCPHCDDDHELPLLGLEFLDSLREMDIDERNESHR